ncbi:MULTISPECIES: Gfo/Idh/MocA family oxidoreductase [unclassified Sinorhizobium]|uniref:Gfo/Idh/MocA family protein n=1 Tax=unclassified Sinorhizobium TaxID=2613772 RepID=UPI0024C3B5C1|nr:MULTISPECIES: Gfo/Idh/MocA family oxidoreductase [unclassified Sinorhizobium]MDK1374693.1 Gfo/Idh/MocA family oxidoreductase [Sinorhizobium sp. 6-70]MDK1481125.1 Gfo/Idh/MocA family oxidoreductase [Sinorhizobium sp. 6-117]
MILRAVLCGCGAMAKGWLKAIVTHRELQSSIRIVGLVDVNVEAARALAKEFDLPDAIVGSDLDAVLSETKPDLLFDIVVPAARHEVVAVGLRHGCHVLSEKPMATSLAAGRELIRLAGEAGRIHAVVQNRRFISGVRRIRHFVESGAIGKLTALHCDFFIGAHFGGFREEMDNVLLLDMAIHTFDAARFIADKTPLAVYCHESNPRGSWYAHGAAANAIFELSDDVTFTYRGSWCAEGANTSWESQWRIIGTEGTLLWDGAESFQANKVAGSEGFLRDLLAIEVPDPADQAETHGHASVIADFVAAIRSGKKPETASDDNINSLAMVFAAIESARSRQRVTI